MEAANELAKDYGHLITLVLTLGIVITSALSVYVAYTLLHENRILRLAGTEPDVIAYLKPHKIHVNIVILHIHNIGKGPAKNIWYRLLIDEDIAKKNKINIPIESNATISFLPQNDEVIAFFGTGPALLSEPRVPIIKVKIAFERPNGKMKSNYCKLDIAPFETLHSIGSDPIYEISKTLKNIERTLRS